MHEDCIPTRMPGLLDQAGLLVRRDGKPQGRHDSIDGIGPYGEMRKFLVR